jgi:hypothetical protein
VSSVTGSEIGEQRWIGQVKHATQTPKAQVGIIVKAGMIAAEGREKNGEEAIASREGVQLPTRNSIYHREAV